jgi:hypothetical protein
MCKVAPSSATWIGPQKDANLVLQLQPDSSGTVSLTLIHIGMVGIDTDGVWRSLRSWGEGESEAKLQGKLSRQGAINLLEKLEASHTRCNQDGRVEHNRLVKQGASLN